jgi:hypothetical protein
LSRTLNLLPYGDLINEFVYLHSNDGGAVPIEGKTL